MKRNLTLAGALVLGVSLFPALAQEPDNTGKNKRDRSPSAVTADQQGGSKEDRELARAVRKDILDDKSMSTNARNVKVVVRNGKLTLRGPVANETEKTKIREIAARHAGAGMVDDKLEITATNK